MPLSSTRVARLVLSIAALLLVSCGGSKTELVVLINTDYEVPFGLDGIRLEISGLGESEFYPYFPSGPADLPIVFPYSPKGGLGPVTFTVIGFAGTRELVRQTRRTLAVQGQTRALPFFLTRSCADAECPVGTTCAEEMCSPVDVPPESLPPFDGLTDGGIGFDPGFLDASVDGSFPLFPDATFLDAGRRDGSLEAGTFDGSFPFDAPPDLDAGVPEDAGGPGECGATALEDTPYGCAFWATFTPSSTLYAEFGLGLGFYNPNDAPVTVSLSRGGSSLGSETVPARGTAQLTVPVDAALRSAASGVAAGRAIAITSPRPIAAWQVGANPASLPMDCAGEVGSDGSCAAPVADGSTLVPVRKLGTRHVVVSAPARRTRRVPEFGVPETTTAPGFLTVVGADVEAVDVTITSTANVVAGGGVSAMTPGGTQVVSLEPGDVLTLVTDVPTSCPAGSPSETAGRDTFTYCTVGATYDLTGTFVEATGPVAVFSGHDCAFVPTDSRACGHLEAAIPSVESLGRDHLLARTPSFGAKVARFRVVAAEDFTFVDFEPGIAPAGRLDAGQFMEVVATQDAVVIAAGPLLVAQLTPGASGASPSDASGRPSMGLVTPASAWTTELPLWLPAGWRGWALVSADAGATVSRSGSAIGGFTGVGDYQVARVEISGSDHLFTSTSGDVDVSLLGLSGSASFLWPSREW